MDLLMVDVKHRKCRTKSGGRFAKKSCLNEVNDAKIGFMTSAQTGHLRKIDTPGIFSYVSFSLLTRLDKALFKTHVTCIVRPKQLNV